MRKETKEKINNIIEEFKTTKLERIDTSTNFIKLESYKVTINNGDVFYRDKIVKYNGYGSSASVLPVLKNGNFLLIGEPRVFTETTVELCIPGGYMEVDEDPKEGAARELKEETGLVSDNILEVSSFYTDLGNSDHINYVFIAFDCEYHEDIKLDDGKFEVVLIKEPKNIFHTIGLVFKIIFGNFKDKCVYYFKTDKLHIESLTENCGWSIDGEYGGSNKVIDIRNEKKWSRYLVPIK